MAEFFNDLGAALGWAAIVGLILWGLGAKANWDARQAKKRPLFRRP